ncbi:MAG: transposase [Armatimonadota bacterium]
MIIPAFLTLLGTWRPTFASAQSWQRAVAHALALIAHLGRGTVTALLRALGQTTGSWHAAYRFYTTRPWTPTALFTTLLRECLPWCPADYVVVGLDDTACRKTGKKIPFTGWGRDPLSPHFHVNLQRQLRFLHAVVLLPLYQCGETMARAIPIRFQCVPSVPKPPKTATPAETTAHTRAHAGETLVAVAWHLVQELRQTLETLGQGTRTLLLVGDGSFCTKAFFQTPLPGVEVLTRCRKNLPLCRPAPPGGRRVYAPDTFTPEAVRQDATVPWQTGTFWYGGAQREIRYKVVDDLRWRGGAKRRRLRLLVLAATPYRRRKRGKLNYREPAYLLTTASAAPVPFLLQSYLDRWQIEVAHREEKTLFHVGEAQVRHPQAVVRQPAFTVAVYGALLLAALQATAFDRAAGYGPWPAWYAGAPRLSLEDILRQCRRELLEHPEWTAPYGVQFDATTLVLAAAA